MYVYLYLFIMYFKIANNHKIIFTDFQNHSRFKRTVSSSGQVKFCNFLPQTVMYIKNEAYFIFTKIGQGSCKKVLPLCDCQDLYIQLSSNVTSLPNIRPHLQLSSPHFQILFSSIQDLSAQRLSTRPYLTSHYILNVRALANIIHNKM